MASQMRASSFQKLKRSNTGTSRKIINPYDSDSDVSFVQPWGSKKATVISQTLLDKISNNVSNNATAAHNFGQKIIQTLVASDSEESDECGSTDPRRARKKAMNLILDQAGRCAASLQQTVSQDVPDACMTVVQTNPCFGLIRNDDDSSHDERPKRRMRKKKVKKFSEVRSHDGSLSEEISISTDAFSSEGYSSIESDGSHSCSSESTADSVQHTRLAKLRRRRKNFLRRRAMEHAAGAETEDEEEASFHYGGPRLGGLKKKSWKIPTQELRKEADPVCLYKSHTNVKNNASPVGSANSANAVANGDLLKDTTKACAVPDLVNTSNDESLLNSTYEYEEEPKNTTKRVDLDIQTCAPRRLSSPTNSYSPSRALGQRHFKWQTMDKVIMHLSPSPECAGYRFLETCHLGSVVTRRPCKSMDEIGLIVNDVIIRLNGEDVSSLEAETVSEMINGMVGESIRVSYLRRNMEL